MKPRPFRLAVVNSHPIQYFAPLYAYLNRDPGLDITALYASDISLRGGMDPQFGRPVKWDIDLRAGYRAVFLKGAETRVPGGFWSMVCPDVWGEVRSGRYDGVWLHGYAHAVNVLALLAARSRGLPVFYRSETHLGGRPFGWRRRVRDGVLSIARRSVDAFLAIGTANREYYRHLGVSDTQIFDVPYTVDNDRFIAGADLTEAEREAVRRRYGLAADRPVLLLVAKLTPLKYPDVILRAVARLRDEGLAASVLLAGTGEMEPALRALVAELGLGDAVCFAGFVNQAALPEVYAIADVFVFPADNERWGLVVNEAMCAGVPVIAGARVGCAKDLVHEGQNGWLVRPGDVDSLTDALRKVLVDEHVRAEMGRRSREIMDNWNYERCRRGVVAAVERVSGGR